MKRIQREVRGPPLDNRVKPVIQQVKHSNPDHSLETLEPAWKRQPGSFFDRLSCSETVCDTQSRETRTRRAGRQSLFSPQLPEVFDNKQKRGGKSHIITKTSATPLLSREHSSIMKQL